MIKPQSRFYFKFIFAIAALLFFSRSKAIAQFIFSKDSIAKNYLAPPLAPNSGDSTKGFSNFIFSFAPIDSNVKAVNYYQPTLDTMVLPKYSIANSRLLKNLQPKIEMEQPVPQQPTNWLFYFIVALVALVVFVKTLFTKFLNDIFKSFFNLQAAIQTLRQQDVRFSVPAILLMLNFYLALALFLFLSFYKKHHQLTFSQYWLLPVFAGGIAVFFTAKFLMYRLSILLFAPKGEVKTIAQMDFLMAQVAGIILLPVLLVLGFSIDSLQQITWIVTWCLLGGLVAYRYFLGWRIAGNYLFNNGLHFIVYICSVEIAPILIMIKIINRWAIIG